MSYNDRHGRDYDRRRHSRSRSRSRSRERFSSSHNTYRHRNEDFTRNNERRRSRERDRSPRDRDQERSRPRDDTRYREYDRHSRRDYRDNNSYGHQYNDREDDQRYEEREHRQAEPSKVLIIRGLDAYLTEDIIADTFKVYCPVESVRVIKNKTTGESRGFAFITFQSIELAQHVLTTLNNRIDVISQGRTIRGDLDYAFSNPRPESTPHPARTDWICPKCGGHNFSRRVQCYQCKLDKPADANLAPPINGQQQYWDPNQAAQNYWQDPNTAYAEYPPNQYPAAAYGADPNQYPAYYQQQYEPQQVAVPTTVVVAAQPAASEDLDSEFSSFLAEVGSSDTASTTQPQQWPPGMQFVWEDSKGCYIDAQTGYCFEAISGLYFKRLDNDKMEYYTYDMAANVFVPHVEAPKPSPAPAPKTVISAQPVKVISAQPTINVISAPPVIEKAAQVEEKPAASAAKATPVSISFSKTSAKDFDKWNQKKQELRAAFEKEEVEENSNGEENSTSDPTNAEEEEVSEEPEEEEEPITAGTICMLCQRELQTEAKLEKHLTQSELHKKNLEVREEQRRQKQQDRLARKLYKQQLQSLKNASKKRKKSWGKNKKNKKQKTELNPLTSGPPTAGLGYGGAAVSATPAVPALDDDSPAARMMRKMGWRGGGLGAKESGMENPVQVTMRTERTGLGSESEIPTPEDLTILPTDTYQTATRKRMLARYNNINLNS